MLGGVLRKTQFGATGLETRVYSERRDALDTNMPIIHTGLKARGTS